MQPDLRDASYLWDMLEAARQAIDCARDVSLSEYSETPMRYLAVERAIQNIGEAANRVSSGFQEAHPEIPWRKMVSQRNFLVHEYGDVDHALIWDLVQDHLPLLIQRLEGLVPLPPQEV